MDKYLAMGMPLNEVVYRSTQKPAEVIRRPELGQIGVGAEADVAVLEIEEGQYGLVDSPRARMSATQRPPVALRCEPVRSCGTNTV